MRHRRPTRTDKVIAILKARKGERVSLPEIQIAGGAQHGARLAEAREAGYVIRNEMEHAADGQVHSWYTLVAEPGESASLFAILPERHKDDG